MILTIALLFPAIGWVSLARADACKEIVPPGASKPVLTERAPVRGTAGELVPLEVVVRHLAGETATLPADVVSLANGEVRVAREGEAAGKVAPKTAPDPNDPTHATTVLRIPFVVLSTTLQRKTFTLPPVRVVVLRKGGGDLSVCTSPHEVAIDQPTASTPDPSVRANPPTMPQKTLDERAQAIAIGAAIAAVVLAAIAFAVVMIRRRPKPLPPPPRPKPSWTIALEQIRVARNDLAAGAIGMKLFHDRLSDAVRAHLGASLHFDALELTTDEMLARLKRVRSPMFPLADVERFLRECDLVKFAGVIPSPDEADETARQAESLVRATARGGP
ncbi:MAG: hypothetical protein ACXVEE_31275 [Polyangiales bacterium]